MAFPAEFLDELKKRNGIVDVINSYVHLQRAGSLYKACCPFHNEKTPSFIVYERTESFYCFGCGAGGDVVSFVMKADNVDYVSAVEILAKRSGLTMPVDSGYNREAADKRKRTLEANREAAKFFHSQLTSGKYKEAADYIDKRGLRGAVNHFGLGYCPPGKKLFTYLTEMGYKPKELQDAFLCTRYNYDIFENRIIFPVIDTSGNVIGFSARSLEKKPADGRKYINTNDTAAFNKRRNLYALNFAKNSKEDFFILCEGQTDVISLHMAGFTNAIASLGTAFSEEQAALMRRYKSKVVICFDGDAPGRAKTETVIKILSASDMETKVISLPEDLDPDEFLKKYGKERFSLILKNSIGQMDYRCGEILSSFDLTQSDQKITASKKLSDVIAALYSPVEREVYTIKYAKQLDITAESFKSVVEQKHTQLLNRNKRERDRQILRNTEGYGDTVNRDKIRNTRAAYAEEALLGIAQINPDFLIKAKNEDRLCGDDFKTTFNRRVYDAMYECAEREGKFDISLISDRFTTEETGRIMRMFINRSELHDNSYEVFCENAKTLKNEAAPKPAGESVTFDELRDLINNKKK